MTHLTDEETKAVLSSLPQATWLLRVGLIEILSASFRKENGKVPFTSSPGSLLYRRITYSFMVGPSFHQRGASPPKAGGPRRQGLLKGFNSKWVPKVIWTLNK